MSASNSKQISVPKPELDDLIKQEPLEFEVKDGVNVLVNRVDGSVDKTFLDLPDNDLSELFTKVHHKSLNIVECTICYKKMKEASMKTHFQTHSKVRPFACNLCEQRFTRRSDMLRHQKVLHRKHKPHVCKLCRKHFSTKPLLLAHLRNHASASIYECGVCRYKFGRKEYYDDHVKYVHADAAKTSDTERMIIVEAQIRQLTGQVVGKSSADAAADVTDSIEVTQDDGVKDGVDGDQQSITVVVDADASDAFDGSEGVQMSGGDASEVQLQVSADDEISPITSVTSSLPSSEHKSPARKKRKISGSSYTDNPSDAKIECDPNASDEESVKTLHRLTEDHTETSNDGNNAPEDATAARNEYFPSDDDTPPAHTTAYEATLTRLLETSAAQARNTISSLAAALGQSGGGAEPKAASLGVTARVGGRQREFGVSLIGVPTVELMSGKGPALLGEMISAACGAPVEGRVCVALRRQVP